MPKYYPIMLDVRGRLAIIIGGDRIAAEKAAALAASGAKIRMLSPEFSAEVLTLAEQEQVTLLHKGYAYGDLADAFVVVVAATNDPQLVQATWNEAQERGQLINIVDVPAYCNFILPSILRRGQLTIAVSTEGASPGLAKRIRRSLEDIFPSTYGDYLHLAALVRAHLRKSNISYDRRDDFFEDFFTSDILALLVEENVKQAIASAAALLQKYTIDISASTLEAEFEEEYAHVSHHP